MKTIQIDSDDLIMFMSMISVEMLDNKIKYNELTYNKPAHMDIEEVKERTEYYRARNKLLRDKWFALNEKAVHGYISVFNADKQRKINSYLL